MKKIIFILFVPFVCLAATPDIIVDSNSDEIASAFVFEKLNKYIQNNYGINALENVYQDDIEIKARMEEHLDEGAKAFLGKLSKEFDKEIVLPSHSLIKKFKDLRIRILIKDISYKLENLYPRFEVKGTNTDGPILGTRLKTSNFSIKAAEIVFALEIPLTPEQIQGKNKCQEEDDGFCYWGPRFILKNAGIETKRDSASPLLEFGMDFQVLVANETKLKPKVLNSDFSQLVNFISNYPDEVNFIFDPETMVIPEFGIQSKSEKISIFNAKSAQSLKQFLIKNDKQVKEMLINEIKHELSGENAQDMVRSLESIEIDRDYLMHSDAFATLVRIEDIVGNPWSDSITVNMPSDICIQESFVDGMKKINEEKSQIDADMKDATSSQDNKLLIKQLNGEKRALEEDFSNVAGLCRQESQERLALVEEIVGNKDKKPVYRPVESTKRELSISIGSDFINEMLLASYESGSWDSVFKENGATLGDNKFFVQFNEPFIQNGKLVHSTDFYMDLIYHDLSSMEKLLFSMKNVFKKKNKNNDDKYILLADKNKAIRFPVHMKVSAAIKMRTPSDEDGKCFDFNKKQIKGKVPHVTFYLDSIPSLEQGNYEDFLQGIKINESRTLPTNINRLPFKKKILEKIDESLRPFIGQELFALSYCNLRDLDLDKAEQKLMGDGRLTIIIPTN